MQSLSNRSRRRIRPRATPKNRQRLWRWTKRAGRASGGTSGWRAGSHAEQHAADLAVAVELLTAALRAGVPWDRAWTRAWTDPSTAAVSARVHATDVAVCAERVGWRQALEDWAAQQPWRAARELGVIAALVWRAGPAGLGALEHTAVRLRATVDLGGQLRADTAQIRASAWVMGALPLVGLCVLVLPSADARAFCLGTSLGRAALAAGAVLDAVGWWWLHSMLRRLERDVGLS